MSEENVKKKAIKSDEMEKDDEYKMELGQDRENTLEIDKGKEYFGKGF